MKLGFFTVRMRNARKLALVLTLTQIFTLISVWICRYVFLSIFIESDTTVVEKQLNLLLASCFLLTEN